MGNPSKPAPRLPLGTCEDLLEKVKWDHQQLTGDWTTYKTFNFMLTANHLYKDWMEKVGSKEQKRRKREAGENFKKIFRCIGDLANASKHWSLDVKNQEKQVVDNVHSPVIADWHAYFVAGPVIYVDILGSRIGMPQLAFIVVKCLNWLVHGSEESDASSLEQDIDQLFRSTKIPT